ncbi:MAG: efflux RND transporter permease subunit [Thiotrichales bacterium]|nr:efflux RND transporter permease subunit [Thiotrichales bacterium]
MTSVTGSAIRHHAVVYTLAALVVIYGVIAYFNLPKQQDPGFTIRAAVITTRFPGASPLRVEQLVTDRIEQAIQEIPALDNVVSESRPGLSWVTANFKESYTDMRPIFDDLRRKVEAVDDLPESAHAPVVNDEYGDVFGSVYALTGEGFSHGELGDIAKEIRDRLLHLDDVAKVTLQGIQEEEIFVEYNMARLREIGMSPRQLSAVLSGINIVRGGGQVVTGRERIALEPSGNFESIEDLRRTVIQIPGRDRIVHLEDIVDIYRDYVDPPSGLARFNGRDAIILSVSLREGGNILALGQTLKQEIPHLEAAYPLGIRLTPVYLESTVVDTGVGNFLANLLQAIGIVVVVMLLFLGLRTGLIVGMLVPATIFATLATMSVLDITINQISLAALIISLGLLVDNAVVVAESILVRRGRGESAIEAAEAAGREMAVPLLTSSLTTAAAFLPIFLAESALGEYTADIFKVVAIALLSSWLLALSLIPLLTIVFLRIRREPGPSADRSSMLHRAYDRLLVLSLKNRVVFLALTVGVFASAVWVLQWVPKVFIPPKIDPIVNGTMQLPRGTAIEHTARVMSDIDRFIAEELMLENEDRAGAGRPDGVIVNWSAWIGQSAPRYTLGLNPGSTDPGVVNLLINTTDREVIPPTIARILSYARERHPDLDVQLRKIENGVPIPYPVEVRVGGEDVDRIYALIAPIRSWLLAHPGVDAVKDDWGLRTKKLLINVDQERALRAGVTNDDIAVSLRSSLSGIELSRLREADRLIPITMRSGLTDRADIDRLRTMPVYAPGGGTVPLEQVADIELAWQPAIIKRRDRNRTVAVQARLRPGVTATDVNREFIPWLEAQAATWPRGYDLEIGGEAETSGNANAAIGKKLPIVGMIILLLLVAQFNSLRKPVIILMTVPLGLVGVAYGLLITGSVFGFFTILGLIALSGIVINNAIVLLDRIDIEIEQNGLAPAEAVPVACRQRLRPILLTTATTIGGMMPLWLSHDPMFETMAVSIMSGLLFATLLTLLFIPVVYTIFFRVTIAPRATVRSGHSGEPG